MMPLIIIAIYAFDCEHSEEISIIPLTMFNYTDTTMSKWQERINGIDYYLIKGYLDNKHTKDLIDSFAHKNDAASPYGLYKMFFYKESSKTNVKHLSANPKDLYRYSQNHDLIYQYMWINGKFVVKYRLKNGEIMEPGHDIKIEEVK
jgi:hypothetical protein